MSAALSSISRSELKTHGREHKHVALKTFTRGVGDRDEFETYRLVSKAKPSHPGYRHVRTALDIFVLGERGGDHNCLVQEPMWDSWKDLLLRNPAHRFSEELLKAGLRHLFLGLDYLHTECKIVHTGKKPITEAFLLHLVRLSNSGGLHRYKGRQYLARDCG